MTTLIDSKTYEGQRTSAVNVDRLLQINVATLIAIATLLLGIGQGNARFPVLAITAAVASVVLTDTLRWLVLNRLFANIGAVAAAAYSLHIFFQTTGGKQLFAIANLLVYLQIILLFQKKDARIYWQLLVLSLLEVVVAAALNLTFAAGLLLVLYMLTAVSALTLFFIQRECSRLAGSQRGRQRRAKRRRSKDAPVASPVASRTSLTRQLVSRRLGTQVAAIGMATLLLAMFLFFATPRRGQKVWQGPPGFTPTQSGFSGDINLNRSTRLQPSDREVMRVAFKDLQTGEPYELQDEPFFRGSVLMQYRDGRWIPHDSGFRKIRLQLPPLPRSTRGFVRQDTGVQAGADVVVFAIAPTFQLDGSPVELQYDLRSRELSRITDRNDEGLRQFRFSVATSGFQNGRMTPAIPNDMPATNPHLVPWLRRRELQIASLGEWQLTLDFNPLQHGQVQEQADQVLQAKGIAKDEFGVPHNIVAAARALEYHFAGSGLYRYTLDLSSIRRSGDPIEDFVTSNRAGHCEFFASALALMLRSQNIRSRVIVGFKGGLYNPVGKYYQVRRRDAHAWVEAYIPPEQVTPDMLGRGHAARNGVWLRLDPTPTAASQPGPAEMDHVVDYMQTLWDDYILGLGEHRQSNSPLGRPASEDPLGFSYHGWSQIPTADWRWAFVLICLGLIVVSGYRLATSRGALKLRSALRRSVYRLARSMAPKLAAIIAPAESESASYERRVEFHERFTDLLSQHKITRSANQTQREFASAAEDYLKQKNATSDVTAIPRQIVEAFYRVRFGDQPLSDMESDLIEQELGRLKHALSVETPAHGAHSI